MKKILLLFWACSALCSCDQNSNKIRPNSKINNSNKTSNVTVIINSDDQEAVRFLNFTNYSYLYGKAHKEIQKERLNDTITIISLDSIKKPIMMEMYSFVNTTYRSNVFISPGDTIEVEMKSSELYFVGKNATLNNFYNELGKKTRLYGKNPYEGDIFTYKDLMQSIYFEKLDFLNSYVKKNQINDDFFIKSVRSELKHNYLFNLIYPKNIAASNGEWWYSDIDGLYSIVQQEAFENREKIYDLSIYFEKLSIEEFKNISNLHNNYYFKNNLNAYIRYYFIEGDFTPYSKDMLMAEINFIRENFENELEYFAVARTLRDYHVNGFGNSTQNITYMKELISEYKKKFTKPSYLDKIKEIEEDLNSFDFQLTNTALNSKFVNKIGDTLSLKNIFDRSNNRIKVIDFWATWCPPCVDQLKKGKEFKDRLMVENNVDWIYLSIDKDYEQWLKHSGEYEVLNLTNSFHLIKGPKSPLASSLNVKGIPRYLIIGKDNKIVLNNAPSPMDEERFEAIIKGMKSN